MWVLKWLTACFCPWKLKIYVSAEVKILRVVSLYKAIPLQRMNLVLLKLRTFDFFITFTYICRCTSQESLLNLTAFYHSLRSWQEKRPFLDPLYCSWKAAFFHLRLYRWASTASRWSESFTVLLLWDITADTEVHVSSTADCQMQPCMVTYCSQISIAGRKFCCCLY